MRNSLTRRRFLERTAATAALAAAGPGLVGRAHAAGAADFPSRPMEILIGVNPGGGTDLSARLVAPAWGDALQARSPLRYVSMPGASGVIAMQHMFRAAPDGHTVMYFPVTHVAWLYELERVQGHGPDSISWLGAMFSDPNILLVQKDSRYEHIGDFIDDARKSSVPFTVSVSTPMSAAHAATVILRERTGAKLKPVAFGGGSAARNAVAGGHVTACMAPFWSALPVLDLTKGIGIFQESHPAPDMWPCPAVNDVLDVEVPHLEEPYAMFCASSVRRENPDVYQKLVDSWGVAVKSEKFLAAAESQRLVPFMKDMDGAACDQFMNDYLAMMKEIKPAMLKDLESM